MFHRTEPIGPVIFLDGAVVEFSPDDELGPSAAASIIKSHSLFPFIGPDSDGDKAEDSGATPAHPTTSKRAREEPSAPPSQRPCSGSKAAQREGDEALRAKYPLPPGATEELVYIAESDFDYACRYPLRGRPACVDLCPMGKPTRRARHHIFNPEDLRVCSVVA